MAPLPPRYRRLLDESQDVRCFSLVLTTSRFRRQSHIVASVKHERPLLQQMAKWRNLPGVIHWGLYVVLPRVHGFTDFSLLLVTFLIVSCSRVCLLDVSRLLGLTLRPSAPVCCCYRDSLTRGRLAIVQEAVRIFSASS